MQELIKQLRCTCEPLLECDYLTFNQAADLIESQAAEIAKYKSLCNQLGEALDWHYGQYADPESLKALEAWRAMK